jgi:hypothetical protein
MRVRCSNVANGFCAANHFARCYPPNPTGADPHNRMDECGSSGVPPRSAAGAESRSARLRWRQCHRAFLGDGSAMEISGKCRTRARGEAGCPCRGSLVVRAGCLRRGHFGYEPLGYIEPKPTFLGIAILVAAAAVMPWLAKEKRRLSATTGSAALRADAAQSALCAYLSLIALAGLAINAIWHVKWADPTAALGVLPLIVREGREAMLGKTLAIVARLAPRSPQSAIMSPTGATDCRGGIIVCHEGKCVESVDRSRLHRLPFLFQSLDGRI